MTQKNLVNPCIRCGKERITIGSHREKIGTSFIVSTLTACPDSLCQAIVDRSLQKEREQRARFVDMNKNRPHRGGRGKVSN